MHSTQAVADKVHNAEFKIIEENKPESYAGYKKTDINGEAIIYAGPYYKDTEVTYALTNTIQAPEFAKVPDARFTLTYNSKRKVTGYTIPEMMQKFMSIEILEEKRLCFSSRNDRNHG